MNKERREKIRDLIGRVEGIRADVEEIKDEEESYFDEMPENLQGGEKGEVAQNAIDELEEAITGLEDVILRLSYAG